MKRAWKIRTTCDILTNRSLHSMPIPAIVESRSGIITSKLLGALVSTMLRKAAV